MATVTLAGRAREIRITDADCWEWTGCTNSKGYGCVSVSGRRQLVHRVSYQEYVGPIPDGFTIDHVRDRGCRSKLCFNPAHLEPVTNLENRRRANALVTHCREGHLLARRHPNDRQRRCQPCESARNRERRAQQVA